MQDRRDVMADGLLGEEEPPGDVGVTQTLGDELQNLDLAWSEAGRVPLCGRPGPARDAADAASAQAPRNDRRRRARVEAVKLVEGAAQRAIVIRACES